MSTSNFEQLRAAYYQKSSLEAIKVHIPNESTISANELERLWEIPEFTFAIGALIGSTYGKSKKELQDSTDFKAQVEKLTNVLEVSRDILKFNPLPRPNGIYYHQLYMPEAPKTFGDYLQYHATTAKNCLLSYCSFLVTNFKDDIKSSYKGSVRLTRLEAQIINPELSFDAQLEDALLDLPKRVTTQAKYTNTAKRLVQLFKSPCFQEFPLNQVKIPNEDIKCIWIDPVLIAERNTHLQLTTEQELETSLELQ